MNTALNRHFAGQMLWLYDDMIGQGMTAGTNTLNMMIIVYAMLGDELQMMNTCQLTSQTGINERTLHALTRARAHFPNSISLQQFHQHAERELIKHLEAQKQSNTSAYTVHTKKNLILNSMFWDANITQLHGKNGKNHLNHTNKNFNKNTNSNYNSNKHSNTNKNTNFNSNFNNSWTPTPPAISNSRTVLEHTKQQKFHPSIQPTPTTSVESSFYIPPASFRHERYDHEIQPQYQHRIQHLNYNYKKNQPTNQKHHYKQHQNHRNNKKHSNYKQNQNVNQ
jgi:hypothetical protein